MPSNPQPDFVMVQLTPHAQTLAAGKPLTISNGRRSISFLGAQPVKVERSYEWKAFLSTRNAPDGTPLFELVPESASTSALPASATSEVAIHIPATGQPEPAAPSVFKVGLNIPATGEPTAPVAPVSK
jgi:hypothetical protein